MQLRSGRRDQDPAKDRPLTPHFIVSVARGPEVSKVRSITELYGLRVLVDSYMAPKGPLQCKRCQRFGHTQRNCVYAHRYVACGGSHLSGGCSIPREQPQCCGCDGNHTASYRGCVNWKEAKAALESERLRVSARTLPRIAPPHPRHNGPAHLPSRRIWEKAGTTSSEGGVLSRTTPPHQILNLLLNRSQRRPRSLK
jgi:hypothetical protein